LENINSGSIVLNNKTLNDKDLFVRPQDRKIGFVFQDYPLFPHLNLRDNIIFNLEKKYIKNLEYMLSLTNLSSLVDRFPHELSGGEQQRACIARALIREPDLLLLDEPFSNLDVAIKHSIRDEIYQIIKTTKTTTILVTHDINDSLNIADKILVFKAGKLQQYSDPVEMYCKPANCYCARILGSINKYEKDGEPYYIRPEKINIVEESDIKLVVEKSLFQGKEYNITAKYGQENWNLFSSTPFKKDEVICVSFEKEDLIYFPPNCLNYF
jgi:ABC-type Fe3+/spermidine/putrescine transport system ATPase subunit